MTQPRALTKQEMCEQMLRHIAAMAHYWATLDEKPGPAIGCKPKSVMDRCNGLAFSILTMLDGSTLSTPAFNLVPDPHEEDKDYHIAAGENWWPDGEPINDEVSLHNLWHRHELDEEGKLVRSPA